MGRIMSCFEPKLRVGLIGLGKMGQNHLRVLSMLRVVDLIFIYDKSSEIADRSAKQYGVNVSSNLVEDLKKVDAVVIATPTSTHLEYVVLVSEWVKNIFVEKPLSDSLESSLKIAEIVERKRIHIQVGYIERFNPAVSALKQILVHDNNVINIDFSRTNRLSNRINDVDVIVDLMIHDIDLAFYFNGEITEIYACGTMIDEMVAFATVILKHNNGSYSRLIASRVTEKKMRQIQVTCGSMFIDCDLLKKEITINKQTLIQTHDYSLTSIEEKVEVSMQEALLVEILDFVKSSMVDSYRPDHLPTIASSVRTMRIATEIQRQIRRGARCDQ